MNKIYIFGLDEILIVKILIRLGRAASSKVHEELLNSGGTVSLVTIKRTLSKLASEGALSVSGKGRSVEYSVSAFGRFCLPINETEYGEIEPDRRNGLDGYNFELFDAIPCDLFSLAEKAKLNSATSYYHNRLKDVPVVAHQKELERFVIELSWKSSRIEGNTYTLLDTERLIKEGVEAIGKTKDEARMILNHKDAFVFVIKHAESFKSLSRINLEELHKIIVRDLNVKVNLRHGPVGVTGSVYRPLDNSHQIKEGVEALSVAVSQAQDGYSKALITIAGLSYIQPFEDGNKRTARIMGNAILLAHGLAPLSYRSVDEDHYREATLVFYEVNSIVPLKKVFIEQYIFAARNYLIEAEIG